MIHPCVSFRAFRLECYYYEPSGHPWAAAPDPVGLRPPAASGGSPLPVGRSERLLKENPSPTFDCLPVSVRILKKTAIKNQNALWLRTLKIKRTDLSIND